MGNQHAPKPDERGPHIIEALKALQSNMDARYKLFNHQSHILYTRYRLLLERGFTEHQALYLCDRDWSNAL